MSTVKFGDDNRLAIELNIAEISAEELPVEGRSAEVNTLATLRIIAGGVVLTVGHADDDSNPVDSIEDLPIIDIAAWFADSWADLVYGLDLPRLLQSRLKVPLAERWATSAALRLTPIESEKVYQWAETHALEFAASDFALPNVVFQRVDDFVEVSWCPRIVADSWNDLVFDAKPGAVNVDVDAFAATMRQLLDWVDGRCVSNRDDTRVRSVRAWLESNHEVVGRAAIEKWYPDWNRDIAAIQIDPAIIATLGRNGTAPHYAIGFLRSAAGKMSFDEASDILAQVTHVTPKANAIANLKALGEGLDSTIDPMCPWESGVRLAQRVRARYCTRNDVPDDGFVDITEWLQSLEVEVVTYSLTRPDVEGACFITSDSKVIAMYNPNGRLSRTKSGRRSTLAHELSHLIFVSIKASVLG